MTVTPSLVRLQTGRVKRTIGGFIFILAIGAGLLFYRRYSDAARGEREFSALGCTGCHFSGAGPNLTHVVRKLDAKFLERFIQEPAAVYSERNGRPLNDGYMLMPKVNVSPEQAKHIVAYLRALDEQ